MANSVNPDQTPRSAASDQGLHCLCRPAVRILRKNTVLRSTNFTFNIYIIDIKQNIIFTAVMEIKLSYAVNVKYEMQIALGIKAIYFFFFFAINMNTSRDPCTCIIIGATM